MQTVTTDIAVIGGGAAGLTAAVFAAHTLRESGVPGRVTVLEGQARVGRKLLATGNGRCNLSAADVSPQKYHTDDPALLADVLGEIPDAAEFFASLGLLCRYDEQRLYPYSNQAAGVLDCLRRNLETEGVQEVCDFFVTAVRFENNGFTIASREKTVRAERVILACGGPASGALGATDSGIRLAGELGHSAAPVFASLTPVRVKSELLPRLKGIRCHADVCLICDGVRGQAHSGEVQFTETGLSGICVFEVSRGVNEFFARGTVEGKPCTKSELSLDLMPEYSAWQIEQLIDPARCEQSLCGIFNKRIAAVLTAAASTPKQLSKLVKDWRFTPSGPSPLSNAQVSAGGVLLSSVDASLQSKTCKGVYLAGESLNVDGTCGGYNLHFAWASGKRAGTRAAQNLIGEKYAANQRP